jgi:hypothetical protein
MLFGTLWPFDPTPMLDRPGVITRAKDRSLYSGPEIFGSLNFFRLIPRPVRFAIVCAYVATRPLHAAMSKYVDRRED